jgi:hypothetical protein
MTMLILLRFILDSPCSTSYSALYSRLQWTQRVSYCGLNICRRTHWALQLHCRKYCDSHIRASIRTRELRSRFVLN